MASRKNDAVWNAVRFTMYQADDALSKLGSWIATDHTRKWHVELPGEGLMKRLWNLWVNFLISVVGTLLSGLLIFVLIAYGIPLLIQFLLL